MSVFAVRKFALGRELSCMRFCGISEPDLNYLCTSNHMNRVTFACIQYLAGNTKINERKVVVVMG